MCISYVSVTALRISQGKTLACTCANRASILTFRLWITRREDSWASQSDLHGFGFSVSPHLFKVMFARSEASPASCDCTPGMSTRGTGTPGECVGHCHSVERLTGRFCCWLGCSPELESLVGKLMPSSPRHTSFKWNFILPGRAVETA